MQTRNNALSRGISCTGHDWWSMGLGLGLSPVAPGTMGTFLGVVLAVFLSLTPWFVSGLLLLLLCYYSVIAATRTASKLAMDDPSVVVSDEVVGFLCAVFGWVCTLPVYMSAFVLFRLLDIVKPWPIRWVDRLHLGGLSIVGDDVIAGVLTNIILLGIWHLFGW